MIVARTGEDGTDEAFEVFRREARRLLAAGARPSDVVFETAEKPSLFAVPLVDRSASSDGGAAPEVRVPSRFVELARAVLFHRDPAK